MATYPLRTHLGFQQLGLRGPFLGPSRNRMNAFWSLLGPSFTVNQLERLPQQGKRISHARGVLKATVDSPSGLQP